MNYIRNYIYLFLIFLSYTRSFQSFISSFRRRINHRSISNFQQQIATDSLEDVVVEEEYYNGPDPLLRKTRLSDRELLHFMRNGHLKTEKLIDPTVLHEYITPSTKEYYSSPDRLLEAYRHKVVVAIGSSNRCNDNDNDNNSNSNSNSKSNSNSNSNDKTKDIDVSKLTIEECKNLLKDIDNDSIPFMQLFNLWRSIPAVQALAASKTLGKIAANLLNVPAVRLYQDTLFVKRPGDGPTQWHTDLNMCPFNSNDFVTVWIPLQDIPSQVDGGSSLSFASASHRDFALPYWSNPTESDLSERYNIDNYDMFSVGDVSWHHGWTLHCAPGNELQESRYALAISYIADGAPLLYKEGHLRYPEEEDYASYAEWVKDIGWGNFLLDHPLVPVVYNEDEDDDFDEEGEEGEEEEEEE